MFLQAKGQDEIFIKRLLSLKIIKSANIYVLLG